MLLTDALSDQEGVGGSGGGEGGRREGEGEWGAGRGVKEEADGREATGESDSDIRPQSTAGAALGAVAQRPKAPGLGSRGCGFQHSQL